MRSLLLLALALASAGSAAAQDRRLEGRLPPPVQARVEATIAEARAQGLPTEPLVQRVLEGAARGAEPERIAAAVREQADHLRTAREALGAETDAADLVAGAGALYAGVSPAELRRLREVRPGGSLAAPLITLADLVQQGVPRPAASAVVLSMVEAGVPHAAYAPFRQAVARDIQVGAEPAAAAHTRARGAMVQNRPRAPRPRLSWLLRLLPWVHPILPL